MAPRVFFGLLVCVSWVLENDADWPETRATQAVFARRCVSCHTERDRRRTRCTRPPIGG